MGGYNSTRVKWDYHTLTPQKKYIAFIQTVRDNFEDITKKEITAAKIAHESHETIVHPSDRYFKSTVVMNPRTHGSIDLGPTGNLNGTYELFCLKTGCIIKC